MFKRVLFLARPHSFLLLLSILSSLFFVFFNSLSIWLTASFISNILSDFETLKITQQELILNENRNINETLKMWTNNLFLDDSAIGTLKRLCYSIFIIFLMKNIFLYFKNYFSGMIQLKIINTLRNSLFSHLNSLSLSFFKRSNTGKLTSIVLNDVDIMKNAFSVSFQKLLVEPINILTFVSLLFFIDWKLALYSLVILPIAFSLMAWVGLSIRRKATRSTKQIAGIVSILQEVLGAIRIVKAFVMEKSEKRKFSKETLKYFNLQRRQIILRLASPPITEMIGVIMGVILLWLGGQAVLIDNSMYPEDFIRFILILFSILKPIKTLNSVNVDMQTAFASAERVFSIIDTKSNIIEVSNPIKINELKNRIEFDNVSFKYEDSSKNILRNISFSINKGEVVAVVGESGSGKSTMADLIPRFFDVDQGKIKIDGQDIKELEKKSLRNLMGIVPQETILFNDTIANNIGYGKKGINKNDLIKVAKVANALNFIENQPDGFNTVIGDRGVKLSGGQRQRISIARALLKNPPILIMDEATSSLDSESEKKVKKAIERLMKNRTVFVIAHRLSTVVNANKIILLKRGKIAEIGTHQDLLKNNKDYKKLYDVQFGLV